MTIELFTFYIAFTKNITHTQIKKTTEEKTEIKLWIHKKFFLISSIIT